MNPSEIRSKLPSQYASQLTHFRVHFELHETNSDHIVPVIFQLRDLERNLRRSYLTLQGTSTSRSYLSSTRLLADNPTVPPGYQLQVEKISKASPVTITISTTELPVLAVLLAIWLVTNSRTTDDLDRVIQIAFNLPAHAVDGLREAVRSLAALVADITDFSKLVHRARLDLEDGDGTPVDDASEEE
jgi:hypothetical protein